MPILSWKEQGSISEPNHICCGFFGEYHPWKLTWQWKIHHLKMYLLLDMVIFNCHVSFGVVIIDKGEQNFVSVQAVVKSLVSVHGTDELEGSLLVFSDKSLYYIYIIFTYHLESRWLNSHWFIMAPYKSPPNLGVAWRCAIYFHPCGGSKLGGVQPNLQGFSPLNITVKRSFTKRSKRNIPVLSRASLSWYLGSFLGIFQVSVSFLLTLRQFVDGGRTRIHVLHLFIYHFYHFSSSIASPCSSPLSSIWKLCR